MTKQFLKEYELYLDLVRLNHPEYFHLSFDTPQTLQHFINACPDYRSNSRNNSVNFYLKNLELSNQKDVFLVLKWLITTHKVLREVSSSQLLEDIHLTLSRMKKPHTPTHIQEYIWAELIRPYTQYLRKLCLLNSKKLPTKGMAKQNVLNDQQLWYIQYNLLTYSLRQLVKPCHQLIGFFSYAFPFLSTIKGLLNHDAVAIYKDLKKKIDEESVTGVSKGELEALENQLSDFQNIENNGPEFEDEPSMSMRVQNFLASNQRNALEDFLLD